MNKKEQLDHLFFQFLSGNVSRELIVEFQINIAPDDVGLLLEAVSSLNDPSDYCKNDYDCETVTGFFLFIDFVSALIIKMGNFTSNEIESYSQFTGKFVPWVIKYVKDERFHSDILSKFY
ncbi:MAG: hypothetical protein HQK77_09135 [Desulfobacterales bacterium]|nr:hypothetical protein [Desulfobacterales bacterium]